MIGGASSVMSLLAIGGAEAKAPSQGVFADAIRALETQHGGRIAAAAYDYDHRRWHEYRGGERVVMCSTHKPLTVAAILAKVDRGAESLARQIPIRQEDAQSYAPVASKHIGGTMSLGELCAASMTVSDNMAANLLFAAAGGPAAVTRFVRTLRDKVTRLDRTEPELNQVEPGDLRDTTTPVAMARLLMRLSLGDALSEASRRQFNQWLIANTTGDRRIRGGLPQGWVAGDKTGAAGRKTNDIAVIWPPGRKPLVVTAFYDEGRGETADARGAVLMEIGRIAARL
jgi:beta-lactamase class A